MMSISDDDNDDHPKTDDDVDVDGDYNDIVVIAVMNT